MMDYLNYFLNTDGTKIPLAIFEFLIFFFKGILKEDEEIQKNVN